jgi:hypothetical protein
MAVKMKYVGDDGFANYDVARETGGSTAMKTGETYEVSEELASRLLIGGGWEAPKSRENALREAAQPEEETRVPQAERLEEQARREGREEGGEE